jgi:hypothetical protein
LPIHAVNQITNEAMITVARQLPDTPYSNAYAIHHGFSRISGRCLLQVRARNTSEALSILACAVYSRRVPYDPVAWLEKKPVRCSITVSGASSCAR